MMPKALSTGNIAIAAHSAFDSLRRLINPSSDDSGELSSLNKSLEDYCVRYRALNGSKTQSWANVLHNELELLYQPNQKDNSSSESPIMKTPIEARSTSGQVIVRKKPCSETILLQSFDILRLLYQTSREAMNYIHDSFIFPALLEIIATHRYSRKFIEGVMNLLIDFFAHEAIISQIADQLSFLISNIPFNITVPTTLPLLRVLMIIYYALKRADMFDVAQGNECKSTLMQQNFMDLLIMLIIKMKEIYEHPKDEDNPLVALTCGTVGLCVLGGLVRSNYPNKQELREKQDIFLLWTFFASNVAKLECTFSYLPNGQKSNKAELQTIVCESTSIWAGEFVEFIIELCTADSFSLQRQQLYAELGPMAAEPPSLSIPVAKNNFTESNYFNNISKWEPLSLNWDAMINGSAFVWRMAAAASVCVLTKETAAQLLSAVTNLDLSAPLTDFIFRSTISNLIILCRASPTHVAALSEADAFRIIIATMILDETVFCFEDIPKPNAEVRLSHQNWSICMAFLTVLIHTNPGLRDIRVLLKAIEDMLEMQTTQEDCEIIEHCLHVLSSGTYSSAKSMWFSSNDACIQCTMEKFVGRWYGYSFTVWINPFCVWNNGSQIMSWLQQKASVVLSVVANGAYKCLSLRSITEKETLVAVLPDTTLRDGWNHIACVHNISGLLLYINGIKRQIGSVSIGFPKETSKTLKISFFFGGGDMKNHSVRPFFGLMTTPQLIDGNLADKDIERLYSAGPGSVFSSNESSSNFSPILTVTEEAIIGLVDKNMSRIESVFFHTVSNLSLILQQENVLDWILKTLQSSMQGKNRNSVVFLTIEMLTVYARLAINGIQQIHEKKILLHLEKTFFSWELIPPLFPQVLLSLVQVKTATNTWKLINHQVSINLLTLLLDIAGSVNCPPATRSCIFKEISSLLGDSDNLKLFQEGPRLEGVLALCHSLTLDNIDDFVALIEKLVKDVTEMEHLFRFLLFEEIDNEEKNQINSNSRRILILVKCEICRMLYDVGKSETTVIDHIVSCNGVSQLLILMGSQTNDSEFLRIYIIRLIALVVHINKKQRDLFFARQGNLEIFAMALVVHSEHVPLRLATFNALFKFMLNYFQPNSNDTLSTIINRFFAPDDVSKPSSKTKVSLPAMNGHLPSLIPNKDNRRTVSMDIASTHSDFSDIETRLTFDDCYNSQNNDNDTIVYPQLMSCIFQLVSIVFKDYVSINGDSKSLAKKLYLNSSESFEESSASSTKNDEQTPDTIISKVLAFADRVLDLPQNASSMISYPWLEWIWTAVKSIIENAPSIQNEAFRQSVEKITRSLIRKIAMADLSKPKNNSNIKRIKDLVDIPLLQKIVIEEILYHLITNNKLEELRREESNNIIRNLDNLMFGIEECIVPFPDKISLEFVNALAAITVHNSTWIRQRIKNNTRLFDVRDRFSFQLLINIDDTLTSERTETLLNIVQANSQEMNASVVLLNMIIDAIDNKSFERVELIQFMLGALYEIEKEHRNVVERIIQEKEVVELLFSKPSKGEQFVQWCVANEQKWNIFTEKIQKAYKTIEIDIALRAERRDKEFNSRIKLRKTENEKRLVAIFKQKADFEKLRIEIESKRHIYTDIINKVNQMRVKRENFRQFETNIE